jgi:NhaP-type Na+/H+ or K+/H+ antiporter
MEQCWAGMRLFSDFFIAYSAATAFYVASRKIRLLTESAVLAGMLYGVVAYVVMYWIVKPIFQHPTTYRLGTTVVAIATYMVCVELPISLAVQRFSS